MLALIARESYLVKQAVQRIDDISDLVRQLALMCFHRHVEGCKVRVALRLLVCSFARFSFRLLVADVDVVVEVEAVVDVGA